MEPRRQSQPRSFDDADLAWFQRHGAVRRSETPAQGIYVGAPAEPGARDPWWQSLLDRLDEA